MIRYICLILLFFGQNTSKNILTRKKRYLAFPEGSTISVAICMTAQMGITPGEIFTEGVNWGISYGLPNDTKDFEEIIASDRDRIKRRHRRDFYAKTETILNSMGYDGRACVLRALCESAQFFGQNVENLTEKIISLVFSVPYEPTALESEDDRRYHSAFLQGKTDEQTSCWEVHNGCPFSLVDLALGHYSD